MKLVDLSDPELKVEDLVIEGGDGIDQFMVKSHGLSVWTDDKTGTISVFLLIWSYMYHKILKFRKPENVL